MTTRPRVALVVPAPQPAQPLRGLLIGDQRRPRGIGRRMADVDHDDVADLVAREQMAAAERRRT